MTTIRKGNMEKIRFEHELAESIEKWGWKYHHLGIPTNVKMPNEKYIPQFKFYVSGFSWYRMDEI